MTAVPQLVNLQSPRAKNENQKISRGNIRLSGFIEKKAGTKQIQTNRDALKKVSKKELKALAKAQRTAAREAVKVPKKLLNNEGSSRTQLDLSQRNLPRPTKSGSTSNQVTESESPALDPDRTSHRDPRAANPIYRTSKKSGQTSFSRARNTASSVTPSKPTVVVEIYTPRRKRLDSPSLACPTLLDIFRQPLPRSDADQTKVISLKEAKHDREAFLLAELKKGTSIARSRASTVEEVFGNHGLSQYYDDIATVDRQKSLAQIKAKKVKRSKIKLDWGTPPVASAFSALDVVLPAAQAKRLLDNKFENVCGGAPLTFLNDRNDRQIDGKFQFIDSYIQRGGKTKPQAAPIDFGCACSKECDPTDSACRCFQTPGGQKVVPYVKSQDDLIVLNPQFIESVVGNGREIFECNDMCNCSKACFNRVVQKGRTIPLQIFMTKHCGFGIRSPRPIKKGEFIDVYLGELLTTKAIEEYESASHEKSSSYVFSLDFFGPASYHIQGLHFGSPTRFINHSCNPNTRTFMVMMNHADQKIYKLAYFAIRDIPAMKEITFDYSPETAHEEPWIPTTGEEEEGVVRCLCGESNCRGRLWPKRQAARRKGRGGARTRGQLSA